jgi:hypothetical protein
MNSRPRSNQYPFTETLRRPGWDRAPVTAPTNAPRPMRGYLPGTSPFPVGNPFEAGAPPATTATGQPLLSAPPTKPINVPISTPPAGWTNVPAPYNWNGQGAAPSDVVTLVQTLSNIMGDPAVDPNNQAMLAETWQGIWQVMTGAGEMACNITPAAIQTAVTNAAPGGPQSVAYALQQLIRAGFCAPYVKNPIGPPAMQSAPVTPPVYPPGGVTNPPAVAPPATTTTTKKVPTWAWVLGGIGVLGAAGAAIWVVTRKKKRKNPCACGNPSVAPAVMSLTTPFRAVANPEEELFEEFELEGSSVVRHRNPPAWAKDAAIWQRAEAAVLPHWRDYEEPYAVVATVYKQMGGRKRGGKK